MLSLDVFRGSSGDADVRIYDTGALIFDARDVGQHVFLLESGTVQIYRPANKHRLILAELKPPDLFGEMALVGDATYCYSARAITTARIRLLPRSELEAAVDRQADLARRLLDVVAGRFLSVLAEFESSASRSLLARLSELLLNRSVDNVVDDLTHQEIAARLRVHRESVSSVLGELRRAGILAIDRKRIRVLNPRRLERASREAD